MYISDLHVDVTYVYILYVCTLTGQLLPEVADALELPPALIRVHTESPLQNSLTFP